MYIAALQMVHREELVVAMLTGAVLLGEELHQLEITAMALIMLALFIKQVKEQPNIKMASG